MTQPLTNDASQPAQDASIVLALSGGGARGLAQIGVIEVLQSRGLYVTAVAGTSCGALVGGCFAAGKLTELSDWMCATSRSQMLRLLDPGISRPAMFTGNRLVRALREVIGEPRIEELPIDFTAVAVDLKSQREVWLRHGDMWDALRASFAIPGIFTPLSIGNMDLVDGGLLAPLPITATRLAGPHKAPQIVRRHAGHAHQLGAIAIDAHMFKAVIVQRDQAHLVVSRAGLHDEFEELGQLILRRRIFRLQRCASRRMLREDMQVAHVFVARQRDAPGQHFGGRQQLVLGGSDQEIATDDVGAVRRHAGRHRNGNGEQDTQAGGDPELHGASTLPRRSPETMRDHSRLRRSTSSTGCSQISTSLS